MTTFIQIHLLIDYPAANLNRDDSGRPKTLVYGGAERLRVSSQSIKRALRTGTVFRDRLEGALGTRAQSFGQLLEEVLMAAPYGLSRADAVKQAQAVINNDKLGKLKTSKLKKGESEAEPTSDTEQLAHLGPDELERLTALAARLAAGETLDPKQMAVLLERPKAADIAMFGRMLADNPGYNVEAAAQVAHAFTTHRQEVEDDYFTAVDELKAARQHEDRGAGFVGVQQFGAGLFYQYACLDASLLKENLSGDADLAARAAGALVAGLAMTSPKGKQNSYASRSIARYGLVEVGGQTPRTLASAFLKPVRGTDLFADSFKALRQLRDKFDDVYGPGYDEFAEFVVDADAGEGGTGTLADLVALAERATRAAGAPAHG